MLCGTEGYESFLAPIDPFVLAPIAVLWEGWWNQRSEYLAGGFDRWFDLVVLVLSWSESSGASDVALSKFSANL